MLARRGKPMPRVRAKVIIKRRATGSFDLAQRGASAGMEIMSR
jgi:hypothetical protein